MIEMSSFLIVSIFELKNITYIVQASLQDFNLFDLCAY